MTRIGKIITPNRSFEVFYEFRQDSLSITNITFLDYFSMRSKLDGLIQCTLELDTRARMSIMVESIQANPFTKVVTWNAKLEPQVAFAPL